MIQAGHETTRADQRAGVPWRDLPRRYGSWKTVYSRFRRWALAGHFQAIFEALQIDVDDDANRILHLIGEQGMLAVIPPTKSRNEPREYDKELYKERNLVERFFARIKHYRGLATRYEKTAESYLALFHLACVKACLL